jgi:hypothetical protein
VIHTYLVAINFYEFDTSKDRFYKLFSHSYPWSVKLFEDVVVIQTEQSKDEIADVIYDCAKNIKDENPQSEGLFESSLDSKSREYPDLFICEFDNHLVHLKDTEKRKYLEQIVRRTNP